MTRIQRMVYPNPGVPEHREGGQAVLNQNDPVPLYHQIKTIIREQIENGIWHEGDQIPTEQQLCDQYRISRTTVKAALNQLVTEGLLYRIQGKGTYVSSSRAMPRPHQLISLSDEILARHQVPSNHLLEAAVQPASAPVARALDLEPGMPVVRLKRLRLADGDPVAIQTAHLPRALCPDLLEVFSEERSLYRLIAARYNIVPRRATEVYKPGLLDDVSAQLLKTQTNAPCFLVERVTIAQNGKPFEFVRSILRGDHSEIVLELGTR